MVVWMAAWLVRTEAGHRGSDAAEVRIILERV